MTSLIERLDAATGPDRELDAEIEISRLPPDRQKDAYAEPDGSVVVYEKVGRSRFDASHYTGSIDAALTLYKKPPDRIPTDPRQACTDALKARGEK